MSNEIIEIKEGILLHKIYTNKFKTNLLSVFLTIPLSRENVTKNALFTTILKRGTKNYKTQEEISKKLEEMYGAEFNLGIEKIGDNHIIKFYLEILDDEFLPKKENLTIEAINLLFELIFNPFTENNGFSEEYCNQEKENLKQIIESKIDNKGMYALDRCIENMYPKEPYGIYKYGYIEDLENINPKDLYCYYKEVISKCKIDIFVSGNIKEEQLEAINQNKEIKNLFSRKPEIIIDSLNKKANNQIKEIQESMNITQGKLVIGLDVNKEEQNKYVALMYNAILGGTPNSKLFQNVREKASLAYTAASNYAKQKNNIFIRCGIEIENYEKAVKIIKEQLEDMKNGNFSKEEYENAKKYIISTIEAIPEEQDSEITYYFGQELSKNKKTLEQYKQEIEKVTKQDIIDIAKSIKINTIYFLKN